MHLLLAILSGLCAVFLSIATDIAANNLPEWTRSYVWLAWPVTAVFTLISLWLLILSFKLNRPTEDISDWAGTNRHPMLAKVRQIWIDGYLMDSLEELDRIPLKFKEQPEAVIRPFDLIAQPSSQKPRLIQPGQLISSVFDELGQALLILGAPGAGKTTQLLELARNLLDRAEKDATHPIPVVFHLSTWAEKQPSLADWLVDELNKRYGVPPKIAQHWIYEEQILPLLDGLDEVTSKHRKACAEAINVFRHQHGLVPLAVCSRVAEYKALQITMHLSGAVVIEPLSRVQISNYLKQSGKSLSGVRKVLREDKTLWELLETPLMSAFLP